MKTKIVKLMKMVVTETGEKFKNVGIARVVEDCGTHSRIQLIGKQGTELVPKNSKCFKLV